MKRPTPTEVLHFTHVRQLPTIVQRGLLADNVARQASVSHTQVANQEIKEMRRRRVVPVPPGGVVADYAPFYFAPRSPMMYVIHRGGVPTYDGGCDQLIYLVSSVERLVGSGLQLVFSDRNAVLGVAEFTADLGRLDGLIDWPLMSATIWRSTDDHPDRKERRMAECLVHLRVPWSEITQIVVKNTDCARQVLTVLTTVDHKVPVLVRPGWYF